MEFEIVQCTNPTAHDAHSWVKETRNAFLGKLTTTVSCQGIGGELCNQKDAHEPHSSFRDLFDGTYYQNRCPGISKEVLDARLKRESILYNHGKAMVASGKDKLCPLVESHEEHVWAYTWTGQFDQKYTVPVICRGILEVCSNKRNVHPTHQYAYQGNFDHVARCPGVTREELFYMEMGLVDEPKKILKVSTPADPKDGIAWDIAPWLDAQARLLVQETEARYRRMFPETQCAQITKHEQHLWRHNAEGLAFNAYCPGLIEKHCHRQEPHDYHRAGPMVVMVGNNPSKHMSYACPGIKKNVPIDKRQCPTKEPHLDHQYWLFPQKAEQTVHNGLTAMRWGAPVAPGGKHYKCDGVTRKEYLEAQYVKQEKKLKKLEKRLRKLDKEG
jgi:hypothetical protein